MKRLFLLIFFLIVLISLPAYSGRMMFCGGGDVARPELVRPTSETVDLTEKDSLEFKWLRIVGGNKAWEAYDFRLYKGYQMLENTLIYKEKLDGHMDNIVLNSNMFQNGETYTWSLRRTYRGEKSQRSWVSFKVVKK